MRRKSRRPAMLAVAAILSLSALALVAVGCSAEQEVKDVEQALHDDVVSAYDETKSLLADAESRIEQGAEDAYNDAKSDFEDLEADLENAQDLAGREAITAYRALQHDLRTLHADADTALHAVSHTVENAEESAWHEIKAGYMKVHDSIDHVVDDLHF